MSDLALTLPDQLVEQIAQRVAAILTANTPATAEPWLDVNGAARHLAVPRKRIYDLCSRRETTRFPVHKDGARSYFRASELDAWREQQEGRPR